MPPTVSLIEIIAAVISAVALLVSLYTLYITKIRKFKGYVVPSSKMSLTWVSIGNDDIPCIYLECQFINQGAKPGKIEDVIIELHNTDGGDRLPYLAFLFRNESIDVYVEEGEQEQSLNDFSSIWF